MPKASNRYGGNGCLNLSGTCFSFKTMKLNLLGANKSSLHRMMLRDKHVNFLTPTISLTNPLWPLFPNFVPTIIEAHLPPKLKVRLCQNEFMKSSIFQSSNSKIWRISALKVLKLNISRYRTIWPDSFAYLSYSPDRQWCPELIHTLLIELIHTLLIESIHTLLI